jgi:hypothetical protein
MPKDNNKAQLLKELEETSAWVYILEGGQGSHLDDLLLLQSEIERSRYVVDRRPRKPRIPFNSVFDLIGAYGDWDFKQQFRVGRETFLFIHNQICNNPVFYNTSYTAQRPVHVQLAITLFKLGRYGMGTGAEDVSKRWSVGMGTVSLYMSRVMKCLQELCDTFIQWPSSHRRTVLSQFNQTITGLPFQVGSGDGVLFKLSQTPAFDALCYRDRKGNFSISGQGIVTYDLDFVFFQVGWCGSVHDNTCFQATDIYLHQERYFSAFEWVLFDSAYALFRHGITVYKGSEGETGRKKLFNDRLIIGRNPVERAFGVLKGRFAILKEIPIQIKTREDHGSICDMIMATVVLHNMCTKCRDQAMADWFVQEEDVAVAPDDVEDDERISGAQYRDLLLQNMPI